MAPEISWEVQKYLLVARAASLILLDTTYCGSSQCDFLSLVGLQEKHPHIFSPTLSGILRLLNVCAVFVNLLLIKFLKKAEKLEMEN